MCKGFHPMSEIFFALCKSVNTPSSLAAWMKYKYEPKALLDHQADPAGYLETWPTKLLGREKFQEDYAVAEFLSKWKGFDLGVDKVAVALQRFTLAEDQCRLANKRIKEALATGSTPFGSILHAAQRKIARLLGEFSYEKVSQGGWGPGATLEIARRRAFVDTKMCELPMTVTRSCLPFFKKAIEADLHWSAAILGLVPSGPYSLLPGTFLVVEGCRIETVDKNAKTDRVIAVEPRGNGFLQKGVGAFIRNMLRRVGIDLSDQGRNQNWARMALSLGLATVDLSMASDTVCRELVYLLLPYDWASYMDCLRSPYAAKRGDKTYQRLEKFSSMGNGFTFELESLVFWALTRALVDETDPAGIVSVYGDDIICPQYATGQLKQVLEWVGFSFNVDKTHTEGLFFESCGKHYFNGNEVTPVYQKDSLGNLEDYIRCGNRVIRLAGRIGQGRKLDKRFKPAWQAVRRCAPTSPFPALPFGTQGDDGWLLPYDEFPFGSRHSHTSLKEEIKTLSDGREYIFRSSRLKGDLDPNAGINCKVIAQSSETLPGDEAALYAHALRRTEHRYGMDSNNLWGMQILPDTEPTYGDVSVPKESGRIATSHRWVVPTGEFSLSWQ